MFKILRPRALSIGQRYNARNASTNEARNDEINQMDLLKRRMQSEKPKQSSKGRYWHEEVIAGQVRRWNYRSEFVDRLGLDKPHTKIWLSFGVIIVIGFSLFVTVKSQVIENRKEQMQERQRITKELSGKFGIVN
ncbi:unnamed protein product [Bursaphelenchus xylophilus]|uniref:(pine wood nematode) hypothetical protein n=1 Tax=Bursaphelenchus xylophilus TaxID=6326 RepID=A0A1I7S347_BURXY|nr:unnamed protein product [Bursaphelenchus xylophilus]CAG9116093.1 unnamed protein product [Bursaphelenchus xylophilus]